jgi:hypothetical protein
MKSISSMSHVCGFLSGITRSCEIVIMHPSFRMVMMTREMTGSVKAYAPAPSMLVSTVSRSTLLP